MSYAVDYVTVTQWGDKYKVCVTKKVFKDNFQRKEKDNWASYEEKLSNSISRTKQTLIGYGVSNDWDLFCTFTLNKDKYDRYNLNAFYTDFTQFLRNLRRGLKCDIQYLLIPEMHEDGAWHMHGFIMGLPLRMLREFTLEDKLPNKLREKLSRGETVYDFPKYRDKFGYCTLEPLRSSEHAIYYMMKYISKDFIELATSVGCHLYYVSRGLKKPPLVGIGTTTGKAVEYDYEGDYAKIKKYDSIQQVWSDFCILEGQEKEPF